MTSKTKRANTSGKKRRGTKAAAKLIASAVPAEAKDTIVSVPALLSIPFAWQPQGRRKGVAHEPMQRQRLDHNEAEELLIAVARACRWMSELIEGKAASTDAIALREQMGERNVRKLLPLACLSPAIIRAIADGSAPADLTIRKLTAALPYSWFQQEQRLLIS